MSKIAIAQELARIALEIQAIKLSPDKPFTWASGYCMPIYNDNRLLLGSYQHRALVADGFSAIIADQRLQIELIAGTSTAGISPGTSLADRLKAPFCYVRPKAKDHGLQNRIEGSLKPGAKTVLIEDLVSTGGSSVDALLAIRDAGGEINTCLSIFSYGLDEAERLFVSNQSKYYSLFNYSVLLEVALERGVISTEQQKLLENWRQSPFTWGEEHGFPRVVK